MDNIEINKNEAVENNAIETVSKTSKNTASLSEIFVNKRKIGICILLSIVTFGIYRIYWQYLIVKNIKTIKNDQSSCLGEMLCLFLIPYYSLYWWFSRGNAVKKIFDDYGYSAIGNKIAYLILGILGLDIVSMAIMQSDFNALPCEASIQNKIMYRKGGYSIAIIALVLAALILLNWLVASLGERFHLEFDMSPQKVNSMSAENIKFLEGIKQDVTITVCADEDNYSSYMDSYAQEYYGISDGGDYFDQTATLIKKYNSYNDKITVDFIDPQSSEFMEVYRNYSNAGVTYGSIIVNSKKGENNRYKILNFSDVYELKTDDTYAAYGYSTSTIEGNNVETALTGAIAYCISSKTPKIAIYTGHSADDYSEPLSKLLKDNNFEVAVLTDKIIGGISDEYDAVAILSPTIDFIDSELDKLSAFLDNGGKLSKGFLYFADANCPSLPNLESFLSQWGIKVQKGVLFETNSENSIQDDPSTMGIYAAETSEDEEKSSFDNSILSEIGICIAGQNVPLTVTSPADTSIKVNAVMNTLDSAVKAPVGSSADWSGYTDKDKKQYNSVIEAKKTDVDSENKSINSYVYAFSSVEYISSDWADNSRVSNRDLVLACSERAANTEDSGITFTSKTISNESFADAVTESSLRIIKLLFVWLVPILVIAAGIFVYVKRRRA